MTRGNLAMSIQRCLTTAVLALMFFVPQLHAQDDAEKPSYTVIHNVKIFGSSD